jgi:hypothetical protein
MQTVVHADGSQATCIACTLSPAWRENLRRVWAIYASTHPSVLWIDDDIRDFGPHECFCSLHLERFSNRIGKAVTREELAAAILKPGAPHPWRAEWIAMRSEISLEVLRLIASAVRQVSPDTTMGLMSSGPRGHCREGREWAKVADALGGKIFSRPTLGNYWEWGAPRGLYFSQDSIKLTRHCLPPGTIDQTEVESVPFSRYSKSVAFTFAQIAISFAFGSSGVTLDVFDFVGTPMEAEPHYGKLLGGRKFFFNALAERAQRPGIFRGVSLIFREDVASAVHLNAGDELAALMEKGYPALEAFEAAGIPTTYDESAVTFLAGQQTRLLTDAEIRALLSQGLFLDGTAAAILCERGFASEIGLKAIEPPIELEKLGSLSAEVFENPSFGGERWSCMSAQLPQVNYGAKFGVMEPAPRAVLVSYMVNPDMLPVHPGMTAFENSLGGRVVVHAWDYASSIGPPGVSFHSTIRRRQMQGAVRWLFRDQPPFLVNGDGVWPLGFRKDCADGSLIGLLNLSLDPWPGAEFELQAPGAIASASLLTAEGRWTPLDLAACQFIGSTVRLSLPNNIAFDQPLFIWIEWEAK